MLGFSLFFLGLFFHVFSFLGNSLFPILSNFMLSFLLSLLFGFTKLILAHLLAIPVQWQVSIVTGVAGDAQLFLDSSYGAVAVVVALTAGRASSLSNPSEDATIPRGVGLERKSLCLTSIGMGGFSIGGRSADSS